MLRRLALLLSAIASGTAQALPPDRIFERAAALTWQVRALAADEKLLSAASGIAVAPGKLLTSCQVLARARQLQLRRGNTIYDAKLEAPDVERDLCQLDAPGLASPAPAIGSARALRPGQRLYVIGYGVGNAVTLGEGLVSAVHDAGAANERIQTTIPAARGLLGAGLYDEEARLVGVVTSSPKDAAASLFAVPADWVAEVAARGAAALAARSKPAAAAAAAASGMPAGGTTWTYGFVDRQYSRRQTDFAVHAMRVDGLNVQEAVSGTAAAPGHRMVNAGESRMFVQPLDGGAVVVEFSPYLLAASGGKAPADLPQKTGYPAGEGLPGWIETVRVLEWESVTVPAGTFRALRVQIDGRRERSPFSPRVPMNFRVSTWYAPEVGRYVRMEHQQWLSANNQYAHETVELLSYRPRN